MEFVLRPWTLDDIDSLVKYANNPNIAANLTDAFPSPYRKENGVAFIKMALQHSPTQIFTIEVNGEASGGIGLHPQADIHRMNMELGYWLAEPHWGKGIMTNAVKQMVEYGFKTFQIDRIFARPFGTSIGSQRVLEKAGFILDGRFKGALYKNGEYVDELIYAVRRDVK